MNDRLQKCRTVALGGMLLAMFFLASNLIPPVYLAPGIPITFQILVVTLMGGLLGVKDGLLTLLALYLATAAGLPMMSSFHGGPAAFLTPTGGFIFGWVFLVLLAGLCRDQLFLRRDIKAGPYGILTALAAAAGVLLDYLAGAVWFALFNGSGIKAVPAVFVSFLVFLPFDLIKCAAAGMTVSAVACTPGLRRLLGRQNAG